MKRGGHAAVLRRGGARERVSPDATARARGYTDWRAGWDGANVG
ncbi:hypothetical protein QF000_005829 [Paraburkholderia atlantica]|uniref:Uncharacterized protein n=1 Tax=Paraburkholderia atlantica TaxID=2654982 RepID=D5WAM2_PARAM|nr:hypothetical protein BC1002_0218 [Paraburkholderia atlantica]MBB5427393.1 hypothetical protein [Paraburkholderia atlantica]MBB5509451.1 hypothetical protein [Paraburkholderia atlantica]